MQHHKYSYNDIENMIPWEKQTYTILLSQWIEEEKERRKAEQRR